MKSQSSGAGLISNEPELQSKHQCFPLGLSDQETTLVGASRDAEQAVKDGVQNDVLKYFGSLHRTSNPERNYSRWLNVWKLAGFRPYDLKLELEVYNKDNNTWTEQEVAVPFIAPHDVFRRCLSSRVHCYEQARTI